MAPADAVTESSAAPAPFVALMGWLLPGGGYFLIHEPLRGLVIGVTVLAMFVFGLLIGGVRVIDVPGFDDLGRKVYVDVRQDRRGGRVEVRNVYGQGRWIMLVHPIPEIGNKLWNVPQCLVGPTYFISGFWSLR